MTDPKHTATAHSPELSCHHATPVPQCCQSDRVDSASTPEPRSAWYVKLDRLRQMLAPWTVTPEMTSVDYTLVVRDRRSALRMRLPDGFVDSTPAEGIYEHVRTCCEADAPWAEPCPQAVCNAPSVEVSRAYETIAAECGGRVSVSGPESPAAGAETGDPPPFEVDPEPTTAEINLPLTFARVMQSIEAGADPGVMAFSEPADRETFTAYNSAAKPDFGRIAPNGVGEVHRFGRVGVEVQRTADGIIHYLFWHVGRADDGLPPDAPVVVNGRGGRQSRLDYLFASTPLADLANAANLSTGAAKYGLDNWRLIAVRDHVNHALAHLYAWLSGDRRDDHLTHADTRIRMANELAIEEQRRMEDAADEESIRF